ncbi:MAG: DegV family EDD domain-containing protein [Desulfobacterales bacterium]|nr:DegV family EDD domain-containing protein [Desulfobacterales bacterium]
METNLKTAAIAGYERVAAWADLLDDINVYPVPDADTGRNLKISLAPIREILNDNGQITGQLLRSATGNSGNIAAAFFSEFLSVKSAAQLPQKVASGNHKAWDSIADPQPGTMLTVFENLSQTLGGSATPATNLTSAKIINTLVEAVQATPDLLPELAEAGVVDSGALGMFLFFEGFFKTLYEEDPAFISLPETFGSKLHLQKLPAGPKPNEVCINTLLKTDEDSAKLSRKLQAVGSSVVTVQEGDHLKIHLHAQDLDSVRRKLQSWGDLVEWGAETIQTAPPPEVTGQTESETVHIVTDAAGSITRQAADRLGITLMDSYIITGDQACPETAVIPETLYQKMRTGQRISTAQASIFERHQSYESICSRFAKVVYICVGSAYTGIYPTAKNWQADQVKTDGMIVLDSGAASGRLGLIAMCVAEFANRGKPVTQVIAYAEAAFETCRELVFLDQLKYLAAGGRISKTGGFFGDLLGVRPVISPLAEGVKKIGVVRKSARQLPLALEYFSSRFERGTKTRILLQYTDNRDRVTTEIRPAIQSAFPEAKVTLTPLSLTSGAHMGPGTWGMAMLPELQI